MRAIFENMPRDLWLVTAVILLFLVHCSVTESLLISDSKTKNETNWVCDLGRTTGLAPV